MLYVPPQKNVTVVAMGHGENLTLFYQRIIVSQKDGIFQVASVIDFSQATIARFCQEYVNSE